MDTPEQSSAASLRPMAAGIILFMLASVLVIEAIGIARDIASGSISDAWAAFFPVLWMDIALLVLLLLVWGISFGRGGSGGSRTKSDRRSWLLPDFEALRGGLATTSFRSWVLGLAVAYAVVLLILQRAVVVDLGGNVFAGGRRYPFFDAYGGPLGWGPAVVWAPSPFLGVLLRPYTVAVTLLLSTLAGFGLGSLGYRWRAARQGPRSFRGTIGAAAGLLVICPACTVSPGFALFASLLAPAAAGGAGVSTALVGKPLITFSTAMLIVSVASMWVGIARSSRRLDLAKNSATARVKSHVAWELRLGRLLLLVGIILAVGVLLLDLAAAPPPGPSTPPAPSGHEGHGGGVAVAPAHDPTAIGLAILGPMIVLAGLVLSRPDSLDSVHGAGLAAGLTLLYVDGILHWFAVLEHLTEAPYALFFVATGAIQVLAVPFLVRRPRLLWAIGVLFTVFLVDLYVVSVSAPAPLALAPETPTLLGNLSKGLELALLSALAFFLGPRMVPARLREALVAGRSLALLLVGAVASDITIGLEAYWRLLPTTVFLQAAVLLGALMISAALAHVRRTGLLAGLTWGIATILIIGHGVYAANYATAGLTVPFLLCLASGVLLGAPTLMYSRGRLEGAGKGSALPMGP